MRIFRTNSLVVAISIFLGICGAPEPIRAESPFEALLNVPAAAQKFDYCGWAKTRSEGEQLPDFAAILEGEDSLAPPHRAALALAKAGTEISSSTQGESTCRKLFETGRKAFEKNLAKSQKKLGKGEKSEPSKVPAIAAAQRKISDLWVSDQAARGTYIRYRNVPDLGAPHWSRSLATAHAIQVDAKATAYMKELLDRYDWPDAHRFGDRIARHAWLLVQHADRHPEFQQLALDRMAPHLETGGVRKRDYAYLWDRVAVNFDREQRYGTQPDWQCENGQMHLMPLENPDSVDQRRAEMDLGPVQQDLDQMSRTTCGS